MERPMGQIVAVDGQKGSLNPFQDEGLSRRVALDGAMRRPRLRP